MKIENTNLSPLASQPTDGPKRSEKRDALKDAQTARGRQDRVEMSDEARLLAKARAALHGVEEIDSERLAALRSRIESGDYTVQVAELARKLAAKLYQK